VRAKRVKNGGKRKRVYTEGWVEFASKQEAKLVAKHVNGSIVGE
jgi:ESF2/ABP1 family protein